MFFIKQWNKLFKNNPGANLDYICLKTPVVLSVVSKLSLSTRFPFKNIFQKCKIWIIELKYKIFIVLKLKYPFYYKSSNQIIFFNSHINVLIISIICIYIFFYKWVFQMKLILFGQIILADMKIFNTSTFEHRKFQTLYNTAFDRNVALYV